MPLSTVLWHGRYLKVPRGAGDFLVLLMGKEDEKIVAGLLQGYNQHKIKQHEEKKLRNPIKSSDRIRP